MCFDAEHAARIVYPSTGLKNDRPTSARARWRWYFVLFALHSPLAMRYEQK